MELIQTTLLFGAILDDGTCTTALMRVAYQF